MVPVMVATCTTMIVLAPLGLMPGMGGFLFKPLALAVAFAMATSFVLSRTYVPMMCANFLGKEQGHGGHGHAVGENGDGHGHAAPSGGLFGAVHHRFERFMDGVTRGYTAALHWALNHRVIVLGGVLTLFVGSLFLTLGIGREFFPQVDAGQITMYLRAPSNLRLDASEQRVAQVEKFIDDNIPADEREKVVSEMGLDPDWSAAYTANSGQQDSVIRIQLSEKRRFSSQEYAIKLRHAFEQDPHFADLRVSFDTGGMVSTALNFGASSPIDVQIQFTNGKDPRAAQQKAMDLAQQIRGAITGVRGAADVRVQQRLDAPYLIIDVDREKAAAAGLSAQDVILQVVATMNSSVSINRNFWIDTHSGNQYFVAVQYPESRTEDLQDLLNIFATGTNQPDAVKLSSLVHLRSDTDAVEVNHTSLYPIFNVLINTENRDIAGVAGDIIPRLRAVQRKAWERDAAYHHQPTVQVPKDGAGGEMAFPNRVMVAMHGEYGRMNESLYNLATGLALASVLVYLLQVALFRSWVGPFIIMFTVPLGLIGVLTMLFVSHTTLNVQSEMGVIFLVGIAVNNGVLLLDFANKQRQQGAAARDAVATAAVIRFRPILMTFLATFLDLIPMAIGFGRGSEANVPLARAVVGGLLTSTALTLFVVPILYSLFIRDGADPRVDLDAETEEAPADGPPASPIPILEGNGVPAEVFTDLRADGGDAGLIQGDDG